MPVPRRPPCVVTSKPDGSAAAVGHRRASTDSTMHCEPNRCAPRASSSGRATAAVLTPTLSAPARSSRSTSSAVRTPPPTVSGMNTCSAVRRTTSYVVARPAAGGGDVEEGQLVGALGVVDAGHLDRVAGVAQVGEVDALDHPPGVHVQARDHPYRDGHVSPLPPRRTRPARDGGQRLREGERAGVEGLADDRALDAVRPSRPAPAGRPAGDAAAGDHRRSVAAQTAGEVEVGPGSVPSRRTSVTT